MRRIYVGTTAIALALLLPVVFHAQGQGQGKAKQEDEKDRKVAGGGITVAGWKGKVDAASAGKGATINDSKFGGTAANLQLVVGPASIYWNPANVAKGDYTVKATFKDVKSDAGHPHSAGLFIGGTNLDADTQSYLYCVAYTNGTAMVRQFAGSTSAITLLKQQPNAAVKADTGSGATNDIAWVVKGGKADCQINGTSVASYDLATAKVPSFDGIYGIRVTHNMNLSVAGFGLAK